MEVRTPAQYQPAATDERLRAPEHVIDLILGVMRQPPRPDGPTPGTVDYARAARAEARIYADRIWAEAYTQGAAWGLARNNQPILVAPGVYDRLAGGGPTPAVSPHFLETLGSFTDENDAVLRTLADT